MEIKGSEESKNKKSKANAGEGEENDVGEDDVEGKKEVEGDEEEKREKDPGKYMDEEEMLDVAEHCFIKMAESLIERGRTARSIFTKYSIPEQFPDGTILELLSPIGFLEGVKEAAGI